MTLLSSTGRERCRGRGRNWMSKDARVLTGSGRHVQISEKGIESVGSTFYSWLRTIEGSSSRQDNQGAPVDRHRGRAARSLVGVGGIVLAQDSAIVDIGRAEWGEIGAGHFTWEKGTALADDQTAQVQVGKSSRVSRFSVTIVTSHVVASDEAMRLVLVPVEVSPS